MAPSRISRCVRGAAFVTSFNAEEACFTDRPVATPHFLTESALVRTYITSTPHPVPVAAGAVGHGCQGDLS